MNRVPQVNLWKLYLEIMHNILLFHILRDELPHGLINLAHGLIKMVKENSSILAILLAILVSVGRAWWSARAAEQTKE